MISLWVGFIRIWSIMAELYVALVCGDCMPNWRRPIANRFGLELQDSGPVG